MSIPSRTAASPSRRAFLASLAAGAIAPHRLAGDGRAAALLRAAAGAAPEPLPLPPGPGEDEEAYWALLREHFLIDPSGIYLNNGTFGPSPRSVLEAVIRHMTQFERVFDGDYAWAGDQSQRRAALAALLGAEVDELTLTRNTTEGMSLIAAGLTLRRGDEVLTTTHEHEGGLSCWRLKARREGVVLRQVDLPSPPRDAGQILDILSSAATSRTRVLSLSHITFTTGLHLPVAEICAWARRREIITVIDGAHAPGLIPVDVAALGCDLYATSPHKWLLAPKGTGLLVVRRHMQDRVWPTIVSTGWEKVQPNRYTGGTLNDSLFVGLCAARDFYMGIGPDRVWERIRALHARLRDGVRALPGATVFTSPDPALSTGLLTFALEALPAREIQRLLAERSVRVRLIGDDEFAGMGMDRNPLGCEAIRLSTHIYTSREEIDAVLGTLGERAAGRLR